MAPIEDPLVGSRKLDPITLPLAALGPVKIDESTLMKLELDQVPPIFQEFPEEEALPRLVCTLFRAAMLFFNDTPDCEKTKPVPKLFHAVLSVNTMEPG